MKLMLGKPHDSEIVLAERIDVRKSNANFAADMACLPPGR
jgi:hypothetical protein